MPAPRKVFRIEEMAAAPRAAAVSRPAQPSVPLEASPQAEVGALRALLTTVRAAVAGLDASPQTTAMTPTRISSELAAVIEGTARATHDILAAAEEIDQAANNLSAALKGRLEQDLAQDIRELVIRIFEACNFQDLAGQRIGKVTAALTLIENLIDRALDDRKRAAPPSRHDAGQTLHGPRLTGDSGHVSQEDVDALFA